MIYNVIDLFAGAGGLSLGFKQTGQVNIIAAAENNPNARKTYKRNFKLDRLYSDVRTIDYAELQDSVGPVDIVIGGPPCQGFSNANRQHTSVISMNNRLVKEYVRAICELNPKAFVMENVASSPLCRQPLPLRCPADKYRTVFSSALISQRRSLRSGPALLLCGGSIGHRLKRGHLQIAFEYFS